MLLSALQITKQFGGLTAVNGVSLNVEAGEIVGLIGPNGAGKTTFLNCIAGAYKPTTGTLIFMGQNVTGAPAEVMCKKGLSRTFQIPRPFPRMNALENVLVGVVFGADNANNQSALQRAKDILDFVRFPLNPYTPAANLNTVQLKRLDLARALACNPKVLLLDELASGLTPSELEDMMKLIREIRDTMGIGMIVVEHIMKLITGICDRVMVIQHGIPIAEGIPLDVMQNPKVIEAYLGHESSEVGNA